MNEEELAGMDLMDTEPEPSQDPVVPLEVISVDELLDRLTSSMEEEAPTETTEPEPVVLEEPSPAEVLGMEDLLGCVRSLDSRLESVQVLMDHPALETSFEDYTVTEGLFLILVILVVVSWCVKMVKGGFSWLLW